jgi:hypothetical protein
MLKIHHLSRLNGDKRVEHVESLLFTVLICYRTNIARIWCHAQICYVEITLEFARQRLLLLLIAKLQPNSVFRAAIQKINVITRCQHNADRCTQAFQRQQENKTGSKRHLPAGQHRP